MMDKNKLTIATITRIKDGKLAVSQSEVLFLNDGATAIISYQKRTKDNSIRSTQKLLTIDDTNCYLSDAGWLNFKTAFIDYNVTVEVKFSQKVEIES